MGGVTVESRVRPAARRWTEATVADPWILG
jgi:hypothetical protein